MNRKDFIKTAAFGLISIPMITSFSELKNLSDSFPKTKRMPVLFLGHGSPMNGIEENEFVQGFRKQAENLDKPKAIIVVSAHWETRGTQVTAMENPRTIHDFGGFPEELYEVQYPAPGHPELAKGIAELVQPEGSVHLDDKWGLDHGAWTVVMHLFPEADVPVIQLSLDRSASPESHYELAAQLQELRHRGVLIVGSGNMVHNLGRIAWDKMGATYGYDWALEADAKMKKWILESAHKELINFRTQGTAFDLSIPTAEHYLPLLYTLALQDKKDEITIFNDQALGGSITMTSVRFA